MCRNRSILDTDYNGSNLSSLLISRIQSDRSYNIHKQINIVLKTFLPTNTKFFTYVIFLLVSETVWAQELVETIAKIRESIVAIGTFQPTRAPSSIFLGTGFVVADGRHILTNAHVIPDNIDDTHREKLAVFVGDNANIKARSARKILVDYKHDIALLAISGKAIPAMQLGQSNQVREGQQLAFTGFPIGMVLGLHPVTHRGIVSAITPIVLPAPNTKQLNKKMLVRLQDPYAVFQLDATAYPGNSGSPLYEEISGKVVGIINKVFVKDTKENLLAQPSGISYAIPIQYAQKLLAEKGLVKDE